MSVVLRVFLVLVAIAVLTVILRKLRKSEIQVIDSVFWFFFAASFVVLAVFPQIAFVCSGALGFESPSNFIFLICLAWMIGMNLILSIIVSRQSEKIKKIIQVVSLDNYEREHESREKIEKDDQQAVLR